VLTRFLVAAKQCVQRYREDPEPVFGEPFGDELGCPFPFAARLPLASANAVKPAA